MSKRGKFIAVEGLDGCGKSTQVSLIADFLEGEGKSVLLTKEPTDKPPIGDLIRKVLKKEISLDPLTRQLLFFADRQEHVKNVILPALESGDWVISDRYFYSTIAYGAMDIPLNWLVETSKMFLKPDIVFLLRVKPKRCLERIGKDKKRNGTEFFERLDKLENVWRNYLEVHRTFLEVKIIAGERQPEEVFEEIKFHLNNL